MKKTISIIIALLLLSPLVSEAGIGKPFFRNWTAMEYGGHNRNFDIVCDGTGRVFVANFEGLGIYDGTGWKIIHTPGISRVTSLCVAENGCVIFGGYNVLGYIEPGRNDVTYVADDKNPDVQFGEIVKIYDDAGTIRFVTSSGQKWTVGEDGITQSGNNSGETESNSSEVTAGVRIEEYGMVITSATGNGLKINDIVGNEIFRLTSLDGLCSDSVNAMAYDGKGSLWGATDNGLFVVNLSPVFSHYTKTDGLSGQVTDILFHKGSLYVGTLQGLFVLGADDRFARVEGISLACWQIALGGGRMLAATAQGLYEINGSSARQLNDRHTLCLIHDRGSVWYTGELNGIYRHSDSEDVLVNEMTNVVSFSKDGDGGIWTITLGNETFCKKIGGDTFEKAENEDMTLLFKFTDADGRVWKSADNNQGLTSDNLSSREKKWCEPLSRYEIHAMEVGGGRIWVGGNFGLICMNTDRMEDTDPAAPVLYVRSFSQNSNDVNISFANDKIDLFGKTMFSYRMHNNDDWTAWNEDQDLNLINMMSGEYQFTARSEDAYGNVVLSDTLKFKVPRPVYLRWYAIVLYVLVLLLIVDGVFKWRMLKSKQRQEELEAQVKERTSQLEAAQDALIKQEREATVGKLTKGLIDRILNPMNYINNFSHLTLGLVTELKGDIDNNKEKMDEGDYEDSLDLMDMMNSNLTKIEAHGTSTTKILKAMEELLKDRKGKVEETNINGLCQQNLDVFKNYYAKDIEALHISVECEICETKVVSEVVAEHIGSIIKSMLANSLYAIRKKYSKQAYQPVIRLSLVQEDCPIIRIYDNGIGIEDSIKEKVFDPFFTTKPTGEAPGIGLYLSQQIIQDAGGSISFESRKDEFTEFTIRLK